MILRTLTRRSSLSPWTYWESWRQSRRVGDEFSQVEAYLFFIGHPRSGTSLVGSLLNAHRDVCVSQELNSLRYVARGYRREQLYWLIRARDQEFGQQQRAWTGYDYRVPGQYQGITERPRVIGDKKAAQTTDLLGRSPKLLDQLADCVQVPLRVLQVIRNPFDVISTTHLKRKRTSLADAAKIFFQRNATLGCLLQSPSLAVQVVPLESLIGHSESVLTAICHFLGIAADRRYLAACAARLFAQPRQSRIAVAWPADLVREIRHRLRDDPLLSEYEFDAHAELAVTPVPGSQFGTATKAA